MSRARPPSRVLGWFLAGACSLTLIGSAAAFALAAERPAPVLFLDLATVPPAAPSIAAVAETAPEVAASSPPAPEVPDVAEAEPVVPDEVTAPKLASAAALALPEVDSTVTAHLFLPPPDPEPKPKSKPGPMPERTPEKKPEPENKTVPEKKKKAEGKTKTAETLADDATPKKAAPAAEASAPSSGSKAKGGAISAAAYAKAVLKKVRSTKRKSGAGKGTVVVGFSIAADGGLAGVQVLQGSGNAELDRIAVDHIRRSAPFPAPPPSAAGRGYSFEFVGK